jgi:hypothetical protein
MNASKGRPQKLKGPLRGRESYKNFRLSFSLCRLTGFDLVRPFLSF